MEILVIFWFINLSRLVCYAVLFFLHVLINRKLARKIVNIFSRLVDEWRPIHLQLERRNIFWLWGIFASKEHNSVILVNRQARSELLWGPGQVAKIGPLMTSLRIVFFCAIKLQAEEPEIWGNKEWIISKSFLNCCCLFKNK